MVGLHNVRSTLAVYCRPLYNGVMIISTTTLPLNTAVSLRVKRRAKIFPTAKISTAENNFIPWTVTSWQRRSLTNNSSVLLKMHENSSEFQYVTTLPRNRFCFVSSPSSKKSRLVFCCMFASLLLTSRGGTVGIRNNYNYRIV